MLFVLVRYFCLFFLWELKHLTDTISLKWVVLMVMCAAVMVLVLFSMKKPEISFPNCSLDGGAKWSIQEQNGVIDIPGFVRIFSEAIAWKVHEILTSLLLKDAWGEGGGMFVWCWASCKFTLKPSRQVIDSHLVYSKRAIGLIKFRHCLCERWCVSIPKTHKRDKMNNQSIARPTYTNHSIEKHDSPATTLMYL